MDAARGLLNDKSTGGLEEGEAAGTSGNAKPSSVAADYAQFVTIHRGNVYRDEEDTEDSDTEYRREAKERNLRNLRRNRLVCHYEDSDSSSSSSQTEQPKYEGSRFNQDNFPSQSNMQEAAGTMNDSSPSALAPNNNNKRKRKSRWDSEAATVAAKTSKAASGTSPPSGKKAKVDRANPEVIKLAVNSFGSMDLDEEQWEKVEQQFQIKQVYHEMLAKRQELDRLAKNGRFKYEYDSDEDLEGGTWEHKLRKAEMDSTKTWTDTSASVHNGRHHIGDFLPPDELKKFLQDKKKNKEDEPATDYQDKKLTEDNKGFQMLQKLGWKDGEGLGASGSGIVNPINK